MSSSRRHRVLAVLFAAYLLSYMDRMVMASAIPFVAAEYRLSPLAMGGVLSAFFLGYSVMQIPGGILADRFGPSRVLTAAIAGWTVFTVLTGTAGSLSILLAIRFLFGLSEGPFPAAASKAVALWFPPGEVGRANGLQLAAANIGAAFAPAFVAPVIQAWGWRSVFYCLLVPGAVLAVVVAGFVGNGPRPGVDRSAVGPTRKPRIGELLRIPALVWCLVVLFVESIVAWGLLNWLPTYLLQARGFSLTRMGLLGSLPYLGGALGYYLGGQIADRYFRDRRQVPIRIALVLGGGMTYLAAVAPTGEWAVVALILAFTCLFAASGGLFTMPLVVVPQEAVGGAFGIVNTAAQAAAFLSPLLVGYVLKVTNSNFAVVLYGFVGLFLVAAGLALLLKQSVPAELRPAAGPHPVPVRPGRAAGRPEVE